MYNITTVALPENTGSISTNVSAADAGDVITISVNPSIGYKLSDLATDPEVEITENTFVMPESDITITGVFEDIVYITKNESLTSIADKIREKTGSEELLEYPSQFVSEINKLSDVSDTTAEPQDVIEGKVFRSASGLRSVGTLGQFTGATETEGGTSGLVPAPSAGDQEKALFGDGTWHEVSGGNSGYNQLEPETFLTDGFPVTASDIWTDGENVYLSNSSFGQYVFNKATNMWDAKTWNMEVSSGQYVWTDGENVYYDYAYTHWVLDKTTSTWANNTWSGISDLYGNYIWSDGENYYHSVSGENLVLDRQTSTWSSKTWTGLTDIYTPFIWTDGNTTYYSRSSEQYVLDTATSTWTEKTWNINFFGNSVWSDGEDFYCTYANDSTRQYVLDKATSTWATKTWLNFTYPDGDYVWTDGENVYYSNSYQSAQYSLFKPLSVWNVKKWWSRLSPSGSNVWTDGENTYYSGDSGKSQYVYDKAEKVWHSKIWNGSTPSYGNEIWTFGGNVYLRGNYVLNKATSTFDYDRWTGGYIDYGTFVWNDGTNCYYSYGSTQYVMDFSTKTLTSKTWTGLTNFLGMHVWSDGDRIYYSQNDKQYVLNVATSIWITKTWNGLTSFLGSCVWTDGQDIYYSNNSDQYVLDKDTSTWVAKPWSGGNLNSGINIWTDGENFYHSNGENQYRIITKDVMLVGKNGTFSVAEVDSVFNSLGTVVSNMAVVTGFNANNSTKYANCSIKLTPGKWILIGHCLISNSVSGYRQGMTITTSSTAGSYNADMYDLKYQSATVAVNQYYTVAGMAFPTEDTTYYAMIYNGNVSASVQSSLYAIKIA